MFFKAYIFILFYFVFFLKIVQVNTILGFEYISVYITFLFCIFTREPVEK